MSEEESSLQDVSDQIVEEDKAREEVKKVRSGSRRGFGARVLDKSQELINREKEFEYKGEQAIKFKPTVGQGIVGAQQDYEGIPGSGGKK